MQRYRDKKIRVCGKDSNPLTNKHNAAEKIFLGSINFSAEPISARLPYLQPDKDEIERDPTEDSQNDEKYDNEKKWKPKNKINSRDFR